MPFITPSNLALLLSGRATRTQLLPGVVLIFEDNRLVLDNGNRRLLLSRSEETFESIVQLACSL